MRIIDIMLNCGRRRFSDLIHLSWRLFSVLLPTLWLFACHPGDVTHWQPPSSTGPLEKRFQQTLDQLCRDAGFPGATAAFALGEARPALFATGLADREQRLAMTPEARMLSGSTGKSFVAAVVLALVQEGRLELDAPISTWLGTKSWFPRLPNAEDLTLRMLLRHQSGIPDHVHSERFAQALKAKIQAEGPDARLVPDELIALVLDEKPLFSAGRGYAYSDTNYILAGMIIEKVTGNSYYAELDRRFLEPLKLVRTRPADRRRLPGLVPGYIRGESPFGLPHKVMKDGILVYNPASEWTGGGLISNPGDLVRWARMLYTGRAIPGDYLDDLLDSVPKDRPQRERYGPSVRYGLGVTIRESRFGTAYGHRGWTPGYLSIFEFYPAHDLAVALQINELAPHDMTLYLERLAASLLAERERTAMTR